MALIVTEADFANLSLLESPALGRRLAGAKRVPSDAAPPRLVTMNSFVACRDADTGARRRVQVVYPHDARMRSADRTSVLSAPGLALLGAFVGDTIEFVSDDGVRVRLAIEEVLHQPESSLREHLAGRGDG